MIRFTMPWVLLLFPVAVAAVTVLSRSRPIALIPRYLAILLAFLALAGPSISVHEDEQRVLLLIDRSASVESTTDEVETLELLRDIRDANPENAFGSVEFGASATLVSLPGEFDPSLPPGRVDVSATRLTPAIELAMSVFGDAAGGQIVLASDGRFTDAARDAVALAEIAGVPVSVLAIGSTVETDVALTSLTGPSDVALDRAFNLTVSVSASAEATPQLAVYRDGELLSARPIEVDAGVRRFTLTDVLSAPGFTTYRAVVRTAGDPVSENDALSLAIHTSEQPDVLVVEGSDDSVVLELLDAIGVGYTSVRSVPDLATLSTYRQMILSEVPLGELTDAEAEAIDRFVRHMGGGLLVIQGEDSIRGFASTKVDELLPLSASVPETEEEASLAIVYVLDRSSSMSALVDDKAKIRILRDATAASAVLLPARSLVGVVGFNMEHDWLIPISQVGNATTVYGMLRRLRASGGTDLYYPLADAVDMLAATVARSKHILLITDGMTTTEPRDFEGLFARIAALDDVSVSAIALGETPNLSLLSEIVAAGRGSLYQVGDFRTLPAVTLDVTQRLSRSRFILDPEVLEGPLVERLPDLPALGGYVLMYPRQASRTLLRADGDAVVSTWQTGLGTVTLLNADLSGKWTSEWVAWPGLSGLFSEILRTTEPIVSTTAGLFPSIELLESELRVLIDARDVDGRFVDDLRIGAQILPDDFRSDATQVGPGLYAASFPPPPEGAYALRIDDLGRGTSVSLPITVPYPAEYRATGADVAALESIALRTGGAILTEAEHVLPAVSPDQLRDYVSVHVPLLLAALAVFLIELVIRKWPTRLPIYVPDRS